MFLIDDLGRDQLSTLEPSRLYGETQYGLLERAVLGSQIGVWMPALLLTDCVNMSKWLDSWALVSVCRMAVVMSTSQNSGGVPCPQSLALDRC